MNKNGKVSVVDETGRELESYPMMIGATIKVPNTGTVDAGVEFVTWDPYSIPVISEHTGVIEFHDFIEGITVRQEKDEATGAQGMVLLEHKEDLHPQIVVKDKATGAVLGYYPGPAGAHVMVQEGTAIDAGMTLAKTPRKARTKDITGGLPRIAELHEARTPKSIEIAKIEGTVEFGGTAKGKRLVLVRDPVTGAEEEHLIPIGKKLFTW